MLSQENNQFIDRNRSTEKHKEKLARMEQHTFDFLKDQSYRRSKLQSR